MAPLYRRLPAVHRLLGLPLLESAIAEHGREAVAEACREAVAELRDRIASGTLSEERIKEATGALPAAALARLEARGRPAYPTVVNATGVLIHTNLGRAPLGGLLPRRLDAYLALEIDLESGRRGQRLGRLGSRLASLCEAEAAVVVNNNAAALLLTLASLARGREVVVSRGQLIEIGGAFRLPEVMRASGCRLAEVGCTNRTHLADYERAISEETAAFLVAHQSNFKVVGFTAAPTTAELARIARRHGLPLLVDQGSGCLHDLARWGLPHEETVSELLAAGADLVCFSGDKLLGGPQAGIVVGRREAVEPLARHPLYRALRPDKLTLAALDEVVRAHRSGRLDRIPLYAMLATPVAALKRRAGALGRRLRARGVTVSGRATRAALGGGTTPAETVASHGLAVAGGQALADRLRRTSPPVVGRLEDDRVVLDLRSVPPSEDRLLERALVEACSV